jgi:uncharacterized protein YqhQ
MSLEHDAAECPRPSSAPPLASCETETGEIETDSRDDSEDEDDAVAVFEWTMAIIAIVGFVAIACVFVVVGVFVTDDADESVLKRRLDTFMLIRGVAKNETNE